jgi:hypothetical protein
MQASGVRCLQQPLRDAHDVCVEAVHRRGAFSAVIGLGEEEALSAQRNHSQRTLRSVVVYLQPTIIAITQQSFPSSECVTNSQRRI